MASLYDLELHESNNFIHSLMSDGQPLSLKLMEDQISQFKAMGPTGAELLKQMEDPSTDMGKSVVRLKSLETDLKMMMTETKLTAVLAKEVNDILVKNPQSLEELTEEAQKLVKDYWLKKKTLIAKLLAKNYTAEELFA